MGRVYPGIELEYNETLKVFIISPTDLPSWATFVRTPLAPGAIESPIDAATGLSMPYTVVPGHTLRFLSNYWSFNVRARTRDYYQTVLTGTAFPETLGIIVNELVAPLDTSILDPGASIPHIIDYEIENIDPSKNLEGFWSLIFVEKIVGSPPFPKIKTVLCKWCNGRDDVPSETIIHECSHCGKKSLYYPLMMRAR